MLLKGQKKSHIQKQRRTRKIKPPNNEPRRIPKTITEEKQEKTNKATWKPTRVSKTRTKEKQEKTNKVTRKPTRILVSAAEFVLFKAAFLRLIHGMVSQLISKLF